MQKPLRLKASRKAIVPCGRASSLAGRTVKRHLRSASMPIQYRPEAGPSNSTSFPAAAISSHVLTGREVQLGVPFEAFPFGPLTVKCRGVS